jgi:hypothetical protein
VFKGARRRWVEAQPEYIVAHAKVRAIKQARVRHPNPLLYRNRPFGLLAAMIDAEQRAVAELEAAKADLREVRRRLDKQFDDAESGDTGD